MHAKLFMIFLKIPIVVHAGTSKSTPHTVPRQTFLPSSLITSSNSLSNTTPSPHHLNNTMASHCHDEHSHSGHDHSEDAHHDHDHSDDITPALQYSLYQHIDFDRVTTLNEALLHSGRKVVRKTWAERLEVGVEVESDADGEFCVVFVCSGAGEREGLEEN